MNEDIQEFLLNCARLRKVSFTFKKIYIFAIQEKISKNTDYSVRNNSKNFELYGKCP